MEERVVPAVNGGGGADVVVRFGYTSPEHAGIVEVVMPSGPVVSAEAGDVFQALLAVREQLEPMGWQLCCNGARLDVWPSGMSRQMSGGRIAYQLPVDRRPTMDDRVHVLDPAPCDAVGSVKAQTTAVKAYWRERRRLPPPPAKGCARG